MTCVMFAIYLSPQLMKHGYQQLQLGTSEMSVCSRMGIDPDDFEGILEPALEKALWERGCFCNRRK